MRINFGEFVGRDACRLGIAPWCGPSLPDGAIPRNDTGHRALQFVGIGLGEVDR